VPAALSLALLGALLAGSVALALSHRAAPPQAAPRREVAAAIARDVLTGRLTDAAGRPLPPASGLGSPERPIALRFVPSSDQSHAGPAIEALVEFLRRRTGYAVEGKMLRDYSLVVQEIVEGRCDVAFLTATSYARAHFATARNDDPEDDLVAFLSVARQGSADFPGSDLAYRGAILVRKDSPLTDVGQLGPEHTLALGSRTSGAGSILPTALLTARGLAPRIQRYAGYPAILMALSQGAVDAAAVWWSPPNPDNPENDARILVKSALPDIFATTRILAFTPWIPNEPVVARKVVPEEVRHVLARALSLYVATRVISEAGRRELEAVGSLVGFIPATDDDFRPLLEVIDQAFANDPDGRADFMAGAK
jgi:phosphate/phosphite/phosphonate ABC transporter binding protein